MTALLEVEGLEALYGRTKVLHGVSFAMDEGGITTILGANGAGKTTTLRAVCGMVRTAGEIRFAGQRIDGRATEDIVASASPTSRRDAGTFVDLTVEENLRVGTYARRDRARRRGGLRARVLGYFPVLRERRRQVAGTLSGGEQQMLAVARALMLRPRLLLLDEPSLGLAPLVVREIFRILRTINREERRERAAGRAERLARARPRRPRLPARDRPGRAVGPSEMLKRTTRSAARTSGTEPVDIFLQQVVSGLATGRIYASLALALVMIYQATDVVNFAQGEMAMFSTYLAWTMLNAGLPYWLAFVATLVIAFVGGIAHRAGDHPAGGERADPDHRHRAPRASSSSCNSVAGWIWSYIQKPFPSPFPSRPIRVGAIVFGAHDVGEIGGDPGRARSSSSSFFRYTPLGLAMRAAAQNPVSSRLVGIRVGWMLALGWGLAAVFGAVAGMMVAPIVFLDPNMMGGIQIYAFAAATLGGLHQPGRGRGRRASWSGVIENLVGTYVKFIGTELKLTVALAMIIVVLLVRPSGLFGRAVVAGAV